MKSYAAFAVIALTACSPAPTAQVTKGIPVAFDAAEYAQAISLAPGPGLHGQRSSTDVARDFLDLSFSMENGRNLPILTRFEGPITVAVSGDAPASAMRDLSALIGRLQAEAGLDIAFARRGEDPSIVIEFSDRATLQRLAPSAACFVVPNVSSLSEFRSRRGTSAVDWLALSIRTKAAIFVPADTSPQEVRDCLHEELAQAVGPLNDLYRLTDSVFNDDNFNTVLTSFDMMMLRIYYDGQLRSGMTREAVAAVIPGIIARDNPGGTGMGTRGASATPRAWIVAIERALGKQGPLAQRRSAADRALSIASSEGWGEGRRAFSHFAVARLNAGSDRARATEHFAAAAAIYAREAGGEVHVAHIQMQLAAIALATGTPTEAIRLSDQAIPVIQRHENAALLATLMLIKAEALEQLGQIAAAASLRLDTQPLARYGFGSDPVVKARMRDIALVAERGANG